MHQAALKPTKGPPLPVTARPLGIRSDPNGIPAGVTSPPLGHPMPKSDQLLALVARVPCVCALSAVIANWAYTPCVCGVLTTAGGMSGFRDVCEIVAPS